jgi:hypothetical protein
VKARFQPGPQSRLGGGEIGLRDPYL